MSERSIKNQDEFDRTMVTASTAPNKQRVVRRRNSSSLQQKIIRVVSLMLALSTVYFALSKSFGSLSPPAQRAGHLRGRKVWVHSDSQLFVSLLPVHVL
jgi:hypothetical protein